MAIQLPTGKLPVTLQDPRNLIIFSKSKMGKSTALAELPNALCIDLEGGYDYLEAVKVRAESVKDIQEICKAVKEAGCPYQFIVLDTVTALEEMAKPLALQMYKQSPLYSIKYENETDVTRLPQGQGFSLLRASLEKIIDMVLKVTPNVILVCHVKDSQIANEDLTIKSIDLLGKTGRILCAKSDAIGYLTRDENSNTILSFNTNDKFVECGARPEHLRNKEIVLGEMQENGKLIFHWDRVFPSLKSKK